MSPPRASTAYDAAETPAHVLFVMDGPPLPALTSVVIMPGHGLEIRTSSDVTVRIGNLHANLVQPCLDKPVILATINEGSATVATLPEDSDLRDPAFWLADSFFWFLDPPETLEAMAERPLARLISMMRVGVVAAASGRHVAGPPIALCRRSSPAIALLNGRDWTQASPTLTVDSAIVAGEPSTPASENVEESVDRAFSTPYATVRLPSGHWRPQLAAII